MRCSPTCAGAAGPSTTNRSRSSSTRCNARARPNSLTADPVQVAAALLHDLGHFLVDEHDEQADYLTEDLLHEEVGASYLQPYFSERLTEPMRLHVPAKRYLCTTDAAYYDALSRASKRSFQLQGGPLSAAERAEFERNPHAQDAVRLRRWDDLAKVEGLRTPGLERYREAVQSCLR